METQMDDNAPQPVSLTASGAPIYNPMRAIVAAMRAEPQRTPEQEARRTRYLAQVDALIATGQFDTTPRR
jgi:hypothetical protein